MIQKLIVAAVAGLLYSAFPATTVLADEPQTYSLSINDRPILTYNAAFVESPIADQPWYGRSGFIHPVYTPAGQIVTDAFPADHPHQHGLMFAWTSAQFDGHPVDFWNSQKRQGHVEHVETLFADKTKLTVRLRHLDDTVSPSQTVLDETWEILVIPHPSMHVFDLVSTQTCSTDRPLSIKEYHYGAMCIRGPLEWSTEKCKITTSEGANRIDANHTRPAWVAMTATIDGQQFGIAASASPTNYGSPQPIRVHPEMPYFCFAPMVLGDFEIKPGEPYVSKFRFVTFDGPVDAEMLNQVFRTDR